MSTHSAFVVALLLWLAACTSDEEPERSAASNLCSELEDLASGPAYKLLKTKTIVERYMDDPQLRDDMQAVLAQVPVTKVSVFLEEDTRPSQREAIASVLDRFEDVARYTYVSSQQALREFKASFPEEPTLWQNLSNSSLPASYRVSMRTESVDDLIARLDRMRGVAEIKFGGESALSLRVASRAFRYCELPLPQDLLDSSTNRLGPSEPSS